MVFRRFKRNSIGKNTIYWAGIAILVILVEYFFTLPLHKSFYNVSFSDSFAEARKIFGGYDAGSYLEGALQLNGDEKFLRGISDFCWILWPPGMSISFWILGNFSFVFNHALSAAVIIQTLAVTLILGNIGKFYSSKYLGRIGIVSAILIFSPFRDWVLGLGFMYGEGPGIAFLCCSFIYVFNRESKTQARTKFEFSEAKTYFIFGALLSGAAYFRSPIDNLVVLSFPIIVFTCLSKRKIFSNRDFVNSLCVYFSYFLFTLPWRVISYFVLHIPLYSWTGISRDTGWAYLSNEQLLSTHQSAWGNGNLNWGCTLEKSTCGMTGTSSILNLFFIALRNPIDFLQLRVPLLFRTMGLPGWELYPSNGPVNVLQSILYCIFIAIVSYKAFSVLKYRNFYFPFMIALIFFYGNFALILVTHFESRYLLVSTFMGILIYIQSNKILNFKLKPKIR